MTEPQDDDGNGTRRLPCLTAIVVSCAFKGLQEGQTMPAKPPKQLTFSSSVALAVAAVIVRFIADFPTAGFLLLLVAYLVLVAGIVLKGV